MKKIFKTLDRELNSIIWIFLWAIFALLISPSPELLFVMAFFAIMPVIIVQWTKFTYWQFPRKLTHTGTVERVETLERTHGLDLKEEIEKTLIEEIYKEEASQRKKHAKKIEELGEAIKGINNES